MPVKGQEEMEERMREEQKRKLERASSKQSRQSAKSIVTEIRGISIEYDSNKGSLRIYREGINKIDKNFSNVSKNSLLPLVEKYCGSLNYDEKRALEERPIDQNQSETKIEQEQRGNVA